MPGSSVVSWLGVVKVVVGVAWLGVVEEAAVEEEAAVGEA
jgi:hypothetical protein|tara:strand:+ start:461 stop:580 length:120 start_codon:yes stop_codon:yes gene_type:complete